MSQSTINAPNNQVPTNSQPNVPINTQINTQINGVCQDKSITCLHAVESGSRAWGFASPDSDYDVRLIYCHEPDWYLRLIDGRDNFEFINNDLLAVPFDIGGWDIRKALKLLYKSNAVILEWLNSPIIYQSDSQFLHAIQDVQQQFFDPRAIFYHYRGMAKTAQAAFAINEPLKLKKWFYLLRALLASVWTLEHKYPPPVPMAQMFTLLNDDEIKAIEDIIAIKQTLDEGDQYLLPPTLQALTSKLWQWGDDLAKNMPDKRQGDIALLDDIFKQTVFD